MRADRLDCTDVVKSSVSVIRSLCEEREVAGSYALGFGWFTENRQGMVCVAKEMRQFDLSKKWQAQKSVIFAPPCRL